MLEVDQKREFSVQESSFCTGVFECSKGPLLPAAPRARSGQDSEDETMAKINGFFKRKQKPLRFQLKCKVPRPVLRDRRVALLQIRVRVVG